MKTRVLMLLGIVALVSADIASADHQRRTPVEPARNRDGSFVTDVFTARFDPLNAVIPFPSNLLLQGTGDLTLNIPVADPGDFGDPMVALNALDGFGLTTPSTALFSGEIAADSVVPGVGVHVFEVALSGPGGGVVAVNRELVPGAEFVSAVAPTDPSGDTLAVVWTRPLKQLSSYLVVVTNYVHKTNGTDATPDQTYFLAKRTEPLAINGRSTDRLIDDATASALEPLRQLVNSQELGAASMGVDPADIVLSWTFTTQSITPVIGTLLSTVQTAPSIMAPSGLTTAAIGLAGLGDVVIGQMSVPYFLEAPSAANPIAPLTGFWEAAPGAYAPPFDAFGLDPTSTNPTFANPLPVAKSTQTIPVLATVPNASSGNVKPASGWPVVIFQHGITRSRMDMFAIADTLALQGFAVVAIDLPLHGITDTGSLLFAGNMPPPFSATERTFNLDFVNNATLAPEPDGNIDDSGTHFANLASLLTARDNNREAEIDLHILAATIPSMDIDFDGNPDFDASRMLFVGQSLGSIVGIPFVALNPLVNVGTFSVPGGGVAGVFAGSATFGPVVAAGLAQQGVLPGTPDFFAFLGAAQTVLDSGDPINYAGIFSASDNFGLVHEVVGGPDSLPDQVVPNTTPLSVLAGTEPLVAAMGLAPITETTIDANGIRGVTRFTEGEHGSLLNPTSSFAATVEMQGEMASFTASGGTVVQVNDASVILTQTAASAEDGQPEDPGKVEEPGDSAERGQ